MLFAIPVGEDGTRFDHFGFCDHFVAVEVKEEDGAARGVVRFEIANPVKGPKGCAGRAVAFQEAGIDAAVSDHVGAPMLAALTEVGIPLYLECSFLEPEAAALNAYAGELRTMTEADL